MFKNKKVLWFVLLVVVGLILLGFYHDKRTCWGSNDFDTYYFAGSLVVSGQNLYTDDPSLSPYLYLPFFAVLLAPLTFLHIRIAAIIWYVISILSFAGSFYLSMTLVAGKEGFKRIFFERPYIFGLVSLVFPFIIWIDTVSLAQIDFMIFFLIVLSLSAYDKKRPFSSGIILAAATVIKIYPVCFLVYFLLKKRFKAVAGFLVGIVLFVLVLPFSVLGQNNFNDSMQSWIETKVAPQIKMNVLELEDNASRFESQLKPSNQSISGMVTRYLLKEDDALILMKKFNMFTYKIHFPHPLTPGQVEMLIKILLLLIFSVSFLNMDYRHIYMDKLYLSLEYSVVFLFMILFFPIVQTHMLASITFPIIALNYLTAKRRRENCGSDKLVMITFFIIFFLYSLQADKYMKVLCAGAFSMILLWILLVGVLIREKAIRRRCENV